jgi:hypothetical protein
MADTELTSSLPPPPLLPLKYTLCQRGSSVLSIFADARLIYSGSQTADIYVRLIIHACDCKI